MWLYYVGVAVDAISFGRRAMEGRRFVICSPRPSTSYEIGCLHASSKWVGAKRDRCEISSCKSRAVPVVHD